MLSFKVGDVETFLPPKNNMYNLIVMRYILGYIPSDRVVNTLKKYADFLIKGKGK